MESRRGFIFQVPRSNQNQFIGNANALRRGASRKPAASSGGSVEDFFQLSDDLHQAGLDPTSELYNLIGEMKQFGAEMRGAGIDVTKVDPTNSDSIRANRQFMDMYGRAQELSNALRVGQKAEELYQEKRLQDNIEGPSVSRPANQPTTMRDLGNLFNTQAFVEIVNKHNAESSIYDTPAARMEGETQYQNAKSAIDSYAKTLTDQGMDPEMAGLIAESAKGRLEVPKYSDLKKRAQDLDELDSQRKNDLEKGKLKLGWAKNKLDKDKLNFAKKKFKKDNQDRSYYSEKFDGLEKKLWDQEFSGIPSKLSDQPIEVSRELNFLLSRPVWENEDGGEVRITSVEKEDEFGEYRIKLSDGSFYSNMDKYEILDLWSGGDEKFVNDVYNIDLERDPKQTKFGERFENYDALKDEDGFIDIN